MKRIPGFSLYRVTEAGEIFSFARYIEGQQIVPTDNGTGYFQVGILNDSGKRQRKYVHRIVAEVFVPNPDNLPEVDHIDGVRANNIASNLRWISTQENRLLRAYSLTVKAANS